MVLRFFFQYKDIRYDSLKKNCELFPIKTPINGFSGKFILIIGDIFLIYRFIYYNFQYFPKLSLH